MAERGAGHEVGRTKDAGWQVGVSRTVSRSAEEVWAYLVSPAGLGVWLGDGAALGEVGDQYETSAGVVGEVRSFRAGDRVRVTWRPAGWAHDTTVQVAVSERGGRAVVRFHQERLSGAEEREVQLGYWQGVMGRVVAGLGG